MAISTSLPTPVDEQERRRALARHKTFVTALLVVAAVIFLACSWWQARGPAPTWVGFVRAAAEAGMVGGLADWFAVTALFRHPLGIPIPHTAIIPRKKDQLGGALSGFVGDNFLNPQLITEKVANAGVPSRVGAWLAEPRNADVVSHEVGKFVSAVVREMDDDEAARVINDHFISRIAEPDWGPPAGRALEGFIADGKTEPVVDAVVAWARRRIESEEQVIVRAIDERMPAWAPSFAKSLVGDKVYRELRAFAADVDTNRDHEARAAIHRFIAQLARDLQHDKGTQARVESLKADVMNSRMVQGAGAHTWSVLFRALIDAAEDADSNLRRRVTQLSQEWGARIQQDEDLRRSLNDRITGAVRFLAENYSGEVTAIISETIQRWDAREAGNRIELMVGKDLQFIRLNGTIVGAVAGLLIYTVSHLLFEI